MLTPTYHLRPDFDERLTAFVSALQSAASDIFGNEFADIDAFVAATAQDESGRDDHILRRTPKSVYLLEAIAYKVYDQTNRDLFNRTAETLIILPDCLSLHNPDCAKLDDQYGDQCQACTSSCQAYEVIQLAEHFGATVRFSKRKLADQLGYFRDQSRNVGIVGVACLLMLATGMRTATELGLPVRGIPLNFTGCEHWNDQPFASQFPIGQLQAILEEKQQWNRSSGD